MKTVVHRRNVALGDDLGEHIERRLAFALSRFDGRIDEVDVFLADLNAERGGIDKECRITARLRRGETLVTEARDDSMFAAVSRAAERLGDTVRRKLHRLADDRRKGTDMADTPRQDRH